MSRIAWTFLTLFAARHASAAERCPSTQDLPQLTISETRDPAVPVIDKWQVLFRGVPISDAQLAALAQNDPAIQITREEMEARGSWVYIGLVTAAVGTVISSVGWYLYGANESRPENDRVPLGLALTMGLGGVAVGAGGVLVVTESIQRPLEPHLAPTPSHRFTRDQMRALVSAVNHQLYLEICEAANASQKPLPRPPEEPLAEAESN